MEIQKRQKIANIYDEALGEYLITPVIKDECRSSYAQYVVMVPCENDREQLLLILHDNEIPTIYYYPTPLHQLPVFKKLNFADDDYKNAITYSNKAFGIPFSPYLGEKEQQEIISVIVHAAEMR